MTEGRVELALGFIWDLPEAVLAERLYQEGFLVAGLPASLPEAPMLDIEHYCAADHVLVSPAGDLRGVVDDVWRRWAAAGGLHWHSPPSCPHSPPSPPPARLLTLPARLAIRFAPRFGLVTATPPVEVRSFPVSVFWHRRNDTDPRTIWLRRQLVEQVGI